MLLLLLDYERLPVLKRGRVLEEVGVSWPQLL